MRVVMCLPTELIVLIFYIRSIFFVNTFHSRIFLLNISEICFAVHQLTLLSYFKETGTTDFGLSTTNGYDLGTLFWQHD